MNGPKQKSAAVVIIMSTLYTFRIRCAGIVAGAVGCVHGVDGGGAYEGEGREGGFE